MRIAYLDCFAGISGDMFLGALLHAGVPASVMHDAVAALHIDASLRLETVDRSGISALKVHVLESGTLAETAASSHPHPHAEASKAGPGAPSSQHRSLTTIRNILQSATLEPQVSAAALGVFELLAQAEARVHNVPLETIHFHEVGAIDAIVDIVAACAGIHALQVDCWYASPVNLGSGMVTCAHGRFPVPAPAVADLLRGIPTYAAHLEKELTTPTGAALLRSLSPSFGPQPPMSVTAIGYGAGTRDPEGFPNVLRLSVGETAATPDSDEAQRNQPAHTVTVLETALDDLSPQVIAYAASEALAAGALDVMLTPVLMKKGRPGTLLTVLCDATKSEALQALLFRETSTLGIRVRQEQRVMLNRRHAAVTTAYGSIRLKIGSDEGAHRGAERGEDQGVDRNVAPEFEDCRAAAEQHGVPLKEVQQAALSAYRAKAATA